MKRFSNKVALVAGGGNGIGAATSRRMAQEGAHVAIVDIKQADGKALVDELNSSGFSASYYQCDCTDAAQVAETISRVVSECGGLHVAANVLGGAHPDDIFGANLHTINETAFEGTMAICLRSIFLLMKYQLNHMMHHGGGSIVNVSSMASLAAEKHATLAYAVAKAGLNHLTQFSASDYAKYNIRINAILPGTTATPLIRGIFSEEQIRQMCVTQQAIARPAEPYEQANAIVWLASDEAAMITGALLPVDGGRSAYGLQGPPASAFTGSSVFSP